MVGPFLDLGAHRETLDKGRLWRAVGVDGRVRDTVRRFPGFKYLSGFPLSNVEPVFFKTAAIQRGDSTEAIRGFVLGYKPTASATTVTVSFVGFDTSTSVWLTHQIATGVSLSARIDCAILNRNLFVSIKGVANYLVTWSTVTNALATRTYLGRTLINVTTYQTGGALKGYLGGYYNNNNGSDYRVMARWFSPRRSAWAPASEIKVLTSTSNQSIDYIRIQLTSADVLTRIQQGYTKLYVYRTINAGGTLYLEQIVNWPENPASDGADNNAVDDQFNGPQGTFGSGGYDIFVGGRAGDVHQPTSSPKQWGLGLTDNALVQQRIYDPFIDAEGDPPISGLCAKYQEGMVIADIPASTNPASQATTVRWSTLFAPSAEMFPLADHFYSPSDPGHALLSLVPAGEYAFAVLDNTILRLHRSGGVMAVNELFRKIGGTGRYGAIASGNILHVVTVAGLMSVDGTSGRQDLVGVLDRLFVSSELGWNASLADVHLAFDGALNALVLQHTTREEMYLVWTGTGAVTTVIDAPFKFVAEGPDPVLGGPVRAWFITSNGAIFSVDHDRSNARQTMCGIPSDVNPQTTLLYPTGAVDQTTAIYLKNPVAVAGVDSPWVQIPDRAVGFTVYFLSGANIGLSRKITGVTALAGQSATGGYSGTAYKVALDATLPFACASGDIVSVAPVVMKVGFHGLRTGDDPDFWSRKTSQGMCAKMNLLRGVISPADNPYLKLHYQMYADNLVQPREQKVLMNEDVTRMWANIPHAGASLLPAVECYDSDVDLELVGVQVRGTISPSGAVNQP